MNRPDVHKHIHTHTNARAWTVCHSDKVNIAPFTSLGGPTIYEVIQRHLVIEIWSHLAARVKVTELAR